MTIHPQKRTWFAINLVGGIAVLGSYAHGLMTHPQTRGLLWGGVPEPLRQVYGVTMWLAAAGYLVFFYYVLRQVDGAVARVGHRPGLVVINACTVAVMVASALWMPLTFAYLAAPSPALWALIRADLWLVGLGAVGLVLVVFNLEPRPIGWARTLLPVALLLFALQTAFLDAFVWPAFFAANG